MSEKVGATSGSLRSQDCCHRRFLGRPTARGKPGEGEPDAEFGERVLETERSLMVTD